MDLSTKTPAELTQLSEEIKAELLRRQNASVVDREIGEVLERARENGVVHKPEKGEAWSQPVTAADAYLAGDIVEHDGATWESTLNGNVWEPGVSGWRRQRKDGKPAAFQQPTGAHDAYRQGEKITHDGRVYVSVIDFNVWSPEAYPAGWAVEGEEPEPPRKPIEPEPEEEAPEPDPVEEWRPGMTVQVGQLLTHNGSTWRVRQAHTTQAGWEPPSVPALFERADS